jgi:plasmid maintenance system antidote protein VapI
LTRQTIAVAAPRVVLLREHPQNTLHRHMRTNISQTAKRLGVHRSTLQAWQREGINLADEQALQERLAASRKPGGETFSEARRRKEVAAANRMETLAAREAGELVPATGIAEQGRAIGLSVRQALDRLAHDLPPQLAGRPAAEVGKILKRHFRETLDNLHHASPQKYFQAQA